MIAATIEVAASRIPVVADIITNTTAEVVRRGHLVKPLGVAALQVTPPHYFFRPDVDALLYPSYQLGARGAIGAILTAAPGPSVKVWNAVKKPDGDTARDLHERLMPV